MQQQYFYYDKTIAWNISWKIRRQTVLHIDACWHSLMRWVKVLNNRLKQLNYEIANNEFQYGSVLITDEGIEKKSSESIKNCDLYVVSLYTTETSGQQHVAKFKLDFET